MWSNNEWMFYLQVLMWMLVVSWSWQVEKPLWNWCRRILTKGIIMLFLLFGVVVWSIIFFVR